MSDAERSVALDTLRGVGVAGILIMNVYAFALPFPAYANPLVMGGQAWYDLATWFATHVLADQKFLSIFSMLFGAGIVLMDRRADARGTALAPLHYRRMGWLLAIGLLHAYLVWFGDILFFYAVCGMILYPARRWRPRTLITVACLLLPVAPLASFGGYHYLDRLQTEVAGIRAMQESGGSPSPRQQQKLDEWAVVGALLAPSEEDLRRDLRAHTGSYRELLEYRAPLVLNLQVNDTLAFMAWRIGGLMLIGMALLKLGVLSGQADPSTYRRLMLYGYGLGLPLLAFSSIDLYAHGFDGLYFMKRGGIANYVGSIPMALGHIGLIMRLLQRGLLPRLAARLAAVGRMAFTNYLLQSLIMTTIFYGYGLGLYGELSRAQLMPLVAAVLALQFLASPWWLARFRYGPVEWLWRSLAYARRQPMRA